MAFEAIDIQGLERRDSAKVPSAHMRDALTQVAELSIAIDETPIDGDDAQSNGDSEPEVTQLDGAPYDVDTLRDYLSNISKTPLLQAAEEVELSKKIEAGLFAQEILAGRVEYPLGIDAENAKQIAAEGVEAYAQFLEANLRLVVSLAKRYAGRGIPILDLIQEGNLGLIRAVEKFDYKKGYKFSTYATWWIMQSLRRAVVKLGAEIYVPIQVADAVARVDKACAILRERLGREPTDTELIEEGGIKVGDVDIFRTVRQQRPISLETPMGNDGEGTLRDVFDEDKTQKSVEETVDGMVAESVIRDILVTLPESERYVLVKYFGLDGREARSTNDIAEHLGLSSVQVRQVKIKALSRLRHPSRASALRHFLYQ